MTKNVDIAIIGGGIAGLSAAAACHTLNLDAHIFETADEFKPLGTSLTIWPNAINCLADWGLENQIAHSGEVIEQIAWRRPNGHPYFTQPLRDIYARVGYKGYCIRRANLHTALLSAIPKENLNLNMTLVSASKRGDKIELEFENGQNTTAKQVIVADGLWSPLRQTEIRDGTPNYAGYGAWLGLSTAEGPSYAQQEACEYLGPNARIGVFPTGKNTRYWFVVVNQKHPTHHARTAKLEEIALLLENWPITFRNLILGGCESPSVYVSFYDRPVSNTWGNEIASFIGDAMHPILPNIGQGACQAIEDAHAIAQGLTLGLCGKELGDWMAHQRVVRVSAMQKTANQIGKLAQNTSPLTRAALMVFGRSPLQRMMRLNIEKQFTRPEWTVS